MSSSAYHETATLMPTKSLTPRPSIFLKITNASSQLGTGGVASALRCGPEAMHWVIRGSPLARAKNSADKNHYLSSSSECAIVQRECLHHLDRLGDVWGSKGPALWLPTLCPLRTVTPCHFWRCYAEVGELWLVGDTLLVKGEWSWCFRWFELHLPSGYSGRYRYLNCAANFYPTTSGRYRYLTSPSSFI